MLEACGTHASVVLVNLHKNVVFLNLHATAMSVKLILRGQYMGVSSSRGPHDRRRKNKKGTYCEPYECIGILTMMIENNSKRVKASECYNDERKQSIDA